MRALPVLAFTFVMLPGTAGLAQVPHGTIVGKVLDVSGAGVPRATITIVNEENSLSREIRASDRGEYAAQAIPPGSYRVSAEAAGFGRSELSVQVRVGRTSTADLTLQVGPVTDAITVAATSDLDRDRFHVAGVVTRAQIDRLPLNGRSVLELATQEPGVLSPVRGTNNRMFLVALGSGLQTIPRIGNARVTMDGASLATIGGPGTALQVSQDAVDEFHVATAGFDVSTGLTGNVAVNIVTRAGGNRIHGTGFAFYRDHRLAAYPGFVKDPGNRDPFFRRVQAGASVGGPIHPNRAFFFGSYEGNWQDAVVAVWPTAPEFDRLGGIFPSPLTGTLLTARVDVRPHPRHQVFVRYSLDDNRTFGPLGAMPLLPSAWSRMTNRVAQGLVGITSVLSDRAVGDVRVSVFSLDTAEASAGPDDCPGCFGLDSPRTSVQGAAFVFGRSREGRQDGTRVQLTGDLAWTMGRHQLRSGLNWEHSWYTTTAVDRELQQMVLWSPPQVRIRNPMVPVPSSFTSVEDVLQLPLRSFQTAVGSDANLQAGFRDVRVLDVVRLYAGDTWRVSPRLTVIGGLAWTYEPNVLNHDLTKPGLLAPILGPDRLGPPVVRRVRLSPSAGVTWVATGDGRTLVRGGVGHYSDGLSWANSVHLFNERRYLMPLGTGRFVVSGANIPFDGRPLDFRQPTAFTGQRLLDVLTEVRAGLEAALEPGNRDFSLRNLNRSKEGSNLADPDYGVPSVLQASLGIERDLGRGFVASADVVYKRFNDVFLNGIDYNRFYSAAGPVIPACSASQRADDRAVCSNGPVYFDTTAGYARYRGLLLRLERRLSADTHLVAAYALGTYRGTNGTATGTVEGTGGRATGFNNDSWFENDGPLPADLRHVLRVSGVVTVPWRVEVAFSIAAQSRPPFSAYVSGLDFNHDGTADDLLPGTTVNAFGRGLDADDLERLVAAYNRDHAGTVFTVGGTPVTAPPIELPSRYAFNDSFLTADVRVGRSIGLHQGAGHLFVFLEIFNVFNTANLVGYGGDLSNQATFGQPGGSVSQVFGSGGPRAAQLGLRLRF